MARGAALHSCEHTAGARAEAEDPVACGPESAAYWGSSGRSAARRARCRRTAIRHRQIQSLAVRGLISSEAAISREEFLQRRHTGQTEGQLVIQMAVVKQIMEPVQELYVPRQKEVADDMEKMKQQWHTATETRIQEDCSINEGLRVDLEELHCHMQGVQKFYADATDQLETKQRELQAEMDFLSSDLAREGKELQAALMKADANTDTASTTGEDGTKRKEDVDSASACMGKKQKKAIRAELGMAREGMWAWLVWDDVAALCGVRKAHRAMVDEFLSEKVLEELAWAGAQIQAEE